MEELIFNVKLDEGAIMPTKAHDADAGFDLYAREDCDIHWYYSPSKEFGADGYARFFGGREGSAKFDTGVHIEIPEGYVGFIKSKSGLNVRRGITADGVIDSGYTGSIVVKLYNHSEKTYSVKRGDKIAQIVFLPIPSITLKQVDELGETDRGDNGFGSSGR